jgi:hypothetical protein
MDIMKKTKTTSAGKDAGGKRTFTHCWWEGKLVQPLWKSVWRFIKKTKNKPTLWHCHAILGHISKGV